MALLPGSKLGRYDIVSLLGAGGMGEVYLARDARLRRDVALKTLPASFATDTERVSRFEREAQILASLNHPHIAGLHGIEHSDGALALVMELVEGPTLADRIAQGSMDADEIRPIALQMVDALEAAHEQGIVHRDLKPANIKIRPDGTVKILDFGLAKAVGLDDSSNDVANSPTLTAQSTQLGMILGTAAYMAPEQARGRRVDRRTDIWAFGCVLFEMLTGRRPFGGDDVSEMLASVLKDAPAWNQLPTDTPEGWRRLLRRCFEKDPKRRLSAIGDARWDLEAVEPAASLTPTVRSPVSRWAAGVLLAAGAIVGAGIVAVARRSPVPVMAETRLSILAPDGEALWPDPVDSAISPDGRWVAFVANPIAGRSRLWVRSLSSLTAQPLPGTDGARQPFWSPDSTRIGFHATTAKRLKTIALADNRIDDVCDAAGFRGGAWNVDDIVVFAPNTSQALARVSAKGGVPVPVTTLDLAHKEQGHRYPSFLPDGDHFVFAVLPSNGGLHDVFVASLRTGERRLIGRMETAPVFAEPGYLVYARQGTMVAHAFDRQTLTLSGEPLPIGNVSPYDDNQSAGRVASASLTGVLTALSIPAPKSRLVWLDTDGNEVGQIRLADGRYVQVVASPDGTRAAVVQQGAGANSSIWLVDLERGNPTPLVTTAAKNRDPVWSLDNAQIAFRTDRAVGDSLFGKRTDGAGPEYPVHQSDILFKQPVSWSPGGLMFEQIIDPNSWDLMILPPGQNSVPVPYLASSLNERDARVSPDGHWVAYLSNALGGAQAFVDAYPTTGHLLRISTQGASSVRWRTRGRQLLVMNAEGSQLSTYDLQGAGGDLKVAATKTVEWPWKDRTLSWDAVPNSPRLLALVIEAPTAPSLTVAAGWTKSLKR